jgi:hypothetical protein
MSRPVQALRASLAGESFAAPGDDFDPLYYGFGILHCLSAGAAEQPSADTGAVMRPAILRRDAGEVGLSGVEVVPIDNDSWRSYRLRT